MEFKHPKYYKELRKRNKSDQSISSNAPEKPAAGERSTGPGLKLQAASSKQQAIEETVPHNDIEEATSSQAASDKLQAPSRKHQASSRKRQAP